MSQASPHSDRSTSPPSAISRLLVANGPALVADGLRKSYGRREALRGLDLEVMPGTICGLLGPNGAGKTTTLRTALGFLRPDQGSMQALGLDCWRDSLALRARVGYLSADMRYYPWLDLKKALLVASQLRGYDLTSTGLKLAQRLNLEPDLKARGMSRGNLQKLGLVLALAGRPELLVLDEPSSGLDPLVQETFTQLLLEAQQGGATILLSSHTFSEVDRLCQVVAVVKDGRVVASEPLSAFRSRAARQIVIAWTEASPPQPPPGLELDQRAGNLWRGRWRGETGPLLRWCVQHGVADVEISAPMLDDAFLDLYR